MMKKKIIISGGGTGGHIFPAIAIADALKSALEQVEILFIGAEGKMEMERVPKAGYSIIGLPVAGLHRKLTLKNLLFPFKLLNSLMKAKKIVNNFKPDAAVGVGGYASGPVLKIANSKGIPTVLQEQNSYPGITNKLLSKKASSVCVAYEGMDRFFPKEKVVLTGNPVRQDINNLHSKRSEGYQFYGLNPDKKTILVLGGSLGSKTLNEAMAGALLFISKADTVQWIWQSGSYYKEQYKNDPVALLPQVVNLSFIERMDLAYACADLVIGRAGALTISEICVAGLPSILVPSPNVAEDHQTKNAMAMVDQGAAKLIPDHEAKDSLIVESLLLAQDTTTLNHLAFNALRLARPDAAKDIAQVIINLINREMS
ncbi:MAG TPA: undecaprenyldiphospho-muramoylpentapeptide beta-N-acetylglucosaminyltransferase [Saprospiraceae bacterium]|nr:undecaprenyldiphospho-muramoylpentapeptide beta-N-acetylglucosaminyltransferase [Saprospiraceae bacterium]